MPLKKKRKMDMIAFEFPDDCKSPIGSKGIEMYMIVDIKCMTFARKTRLVAGGHSTEVPKDSVYSNIVSMESIKLVFLADAFNDLQIKATDIQNEYLNECTKENVRILYGPEFGSN